MLFINGIDIYDGRTAADFLYSLGMDDIDISLFMNYLSEDQDGYSIDYWKQEAKEWEWDSTEQYEKRNSLICDIQELADKLEAGRGGTKKQYADKLRTLCEYWA